MAHQAERTRKLLFSFSLARFALVFLWYPSLASLQFCEPRLIVSGPAKQSLCKLPGRPSFPLSSSRCTSRGGFTFLLDRLGLLLGSSYQHNPIIGVTVHLSCRLCASLLALCKPSLVCTVLGLCIWCRIVLVIPFIKPMEVDVGE